MALDRNKIRAVGSKVMCDVDWIEVALDRNKSRAVGSKLMIRGFRKMTELLASHAVG